MWFEQFIWFMWYIPRRAASLKILCDKTFDISKILKRYGYQGGFSSVVSKF